MPSLQHWARVLIFGSCAALCSLLFELFHYSFKVWLQPEEGSQAERQSFNLISLEVQHLKQTEYNELNNTRTYFQTDSGQYEMLINVSLDPKTFPFL